MGVYVADHHMECHLYTDAITYAYDTQEHLVTTLALFQIVLSEIPSPVAIETLPNITVYPSARV